MNKGDEENRRERRKVRRRTLQNWRAVGWQMGPIPWRQEPLWRKLMWVVILIGVVALAIYIVT
jgi:hypothetical protein